MLALLATSLFMAPAAEAFVAPTYKKQSGQADSLAWDRLTPAQKDALRATIGKPRGADMPDLLNAQDAREFVQKYSSAMQKGEEAVQRESWRTEGWRKLLFKARQATGVIPNLTNSCLLYAAVVPAFAQDPAAFHLERIAADTKDVVDEYRAGDEVVVPMHANIAVAR